jgi:hypothetical protein
MAKKRDAMAKYPSHDRFSFGTNGSIKRRRLPKTVRYISGMVPIMFTGEKFINKTPSLT